MATITRHPRYRVQGLEFDQNLVTANIFRLWELLFGRRHGVRPEASCFAFKDEKGRQTVVRRFYTVEAIVVHIESLVRNLFKLPKFSFVEIPQFAFSGMDTPLIPPIFSFAIAWDSGSPNSSFSASATSVSYSITTSGSNRYLLIGSKVTPAIVSVVRSGDSVVLVDHATSGSRECYLHYVIAPVTSATNVVCTQSPTDQIGSGATSYTGVDQNAPEATNKVSQSATSGTDATLSITTITANAWAAGFIGTNNNYISTDAGTNVRINGYGASARNFMVDSGVVASPASTPLGVTIDTDPGNTWGIILVSLKPVSAAVANGGFFDFFR